MRSLYKIEIDLFLDDHIVNQILERARKAYIATGSAIKEHEAHDATVPPKNSLKGRTTPCWSCWMKSFARACRRSKSASCVANSILNRALTRTSDLT
jgi:hypothetical protein